MGYRDGIPFRRTDDNYVSSEREREELMKEKFAENGLFYYEPSYEYQERTGEAVCVGEGYLWFSSEGKPFMDCGYVAEITWHLECKFRMLGISMPYLEEIVKVLKPIDDFNMECVDCEDEYNI